MSFFRGILGQEVATYWYSAFRQYTYGKEPDILHANVNAGVYLILFCNSFFL